MRRKIAAFDAFLYVSLSLVGLATLLPVWHVLVVSFADPSVATRGFYLIPRSFTTVAYEVLVEYTDILVGYRNTFLYTSCYTALALIVTTCTAFPLSKDRLVGRSFFTFYFVLTMFVGGGLIPTFMVIRRLGMVDTFWVMVVPHSLVIFNMILMRTYFQSIPREMEEVAKIDGAGVIRTLVYIIVPIAKPALATVGLFYAIRKWNDFFTALIYISRPVLYPLQLMLRELVLGTMMDDKLHSLGMGEDPTMQKYSLFELSTNIRHAALFASIFPILIVYPLVQKYFVKGVMVGSLKG